MPDLSVHGVFLGGLAGWLTKYNNCTCQRRSHQIRQISSHANWHCSAYVDDKVNLMLALMITVKVPPFHLLKSFINEDEKLQLLVMRTIRLRSLFLLITVCKPLLSFGAVTLDGEFGFSGSSFKSIGQWHKFVGQHRPEF